MRHAKGQFKHAARRLKRASEGLQNDQFMQSVASGGCNIFKEIRKFRGKVKSCSTVVDGEVGSSNISNHFAKIYSELYGQKDQDREVYELRKSINNDINIESLCDVNK